MNDHAEHSFSGRIDEICDAFEQVWKSNERPSIVKYLKGFDGQHRLDLLREMLLLDIDYRYQRGEDVNQSDYETEIPEVTKIFSELIAEIVNRDTRQKILKTDSQDTATTSGTSQGSQTARSAGRFEILKHHAAGGLESFSFR